MFNRRIFTLKKVVLSVVILIAVVVTMRIINTIRSDMPRINDIIKRVKEHKVENIMKQSKEINVENKNVKRNHIQNRQKKKILIHGDLSTIKSWLVLSSMVDCFKNPKNKGIRSCPVFCPKYNTSITLTLGSKPSQYHGKDAIVFGLSPLTLFHHHDDVVRKEYPPNVLTVFYSMESPYRMGKWIWRIPHGRYHITMTYLTGSNITVPYAYYKPFAEENITKKRNFAMGKTKLMAWMGSNCVKEVFWPRMEFINRLQAYIPIDTYGECGNLTCLPRLSSKCVNMLKQYKFYLAFENSECHEYLTEKFWASSLQNDVVPIVYGASREDFNKLAPPSSYIHVSDFNNLEQLVKYIKLLDENDNLYNKYFEWKTRGTIVNMYPKMEPSYFCEIIPFLGQNLERKPLSKSVWFNSCRSPIKGRFDIKNVASFDNWSQW